MKEIAVITWITGLFFVILGIVQGEITVKQRTNRGENEGQTDKKTDR
jgi:hypothetical protein